MILSDVISFFKKKFGPYKVFERNEQIPIVKVIYVKENHIIRINNDIQSTLDITAREGSF